MNIEKGIPIPATRRRLANMGLQETIKAMVPGDSFFIPLKGISDPSLMGTINKLFRQIHGDKTYASRKEEKPENGEMIKGRRVWRVK